jgi:hypothetical protein
MNAQPPELTDDQLIAQFESAAIPPDSFHHADHVRLAFAYLRQYPILEALEKFPAALQQFARQNGRPNLYHQTITWAYLFLIHERLARAPHQQTWEEFAEANPDLLTWKNGILTKYYCEETLQSDIARRVFILPDNPPTSPPHPSPLRMSFRTASAVRNLLFVCSATNLASHQPLSSRAKDLLCNAKQIRSRRTPRSFAVKSQPQGIPTKPADARSPKPASIATPSPLC